VSLKCEQLPLYGPLVIPLPRQLFNLIRVIGHDYVLTDPHSEPEETDHRQHVIMVIEETSLRSETHQFVSRVTQGGTGLEKFSLFYMGTVDFIEFPSMAVCVEEPDILDRGVHITHVLQTPKPAADYLGQSKGLIGEWRVCCVLEFREKDRDQGETDTSFVIVLSRTFNVWDAHVFTSITLIEEAIYFTMELR
jgi:hypothetical protein